LMRDPNLEIIDADQTPAGRQKARVLTVIAPTAAGPVRFRVKWRAFSTSHGLNDPRKDVAAYAFQKLFLRPEDYVVPPTVGHCFDIDDYRVRLNPKEASSFPSVSCVFGTISYWLEDSKNLLDAEKADWIGGDRLFDATTFDRRPSYRRTLADMNLLNHLIGNGDTHWKQFVFTAIKNDPHIYSVDHSISFAPYRSPRLPPRDDWSRLHVPSLARESVERLRRLQRTDLERLAVMEQYAIRNGILVAVAPTEPGEELDAGLRWSSGQLQIGVRIKEIAYVWDRLVKLREAIDRGEVALF